MAEIWSPAYFLGYGKALILLFMGAFLLYRHYFNSSLTHASVLKDGCINVKCTGFIGTAILTLLIGSQSAIYLSLTLIVENLIIVALMLILAERGLQSSAKSGWQVYAETVQRLLKNPVILSILLGMLCVFINLKLPQSISQILEMLGKNCFTFGFICYWWKFGRYANQVGQFAKYCFGRIQSIADATHDLWDFMGIRCEPRNVVCRDFTGSLLHANCFWYFRAALRFG